MFPIPRRSAIPAGNATAQSRDIQRHAIVDQNNTVGVARINIRILENCPGITVGKNGVVIDDIVQLIAAECCQFQ